MYPESLATTSVTLPGLLEEIRVALSTKADPNAGLAARMAADPPCCYCFLPFLLKIFEVESGNVRDQLVQDAIGQSQLQASPAFNDYTPLIFLASTPPSANGYQVAQAMELLISSRADVHRECGQMFAGRLVPLRFAARAQNEYGLATQQSGAMTL